MRTNLISSFYALVFVHLCYLVSSQPCHSTCQTCSVAADDTACSTCSTPQTQVSSTSCVSPTSQVYSIIQTIQQSTVDSSTYLDKINYDGFDYATGYAAALFDSGSTNVINFDFSGSVSQNVIFQFSGLGTKHFAIIIRAAISDGDSSGTVTISVDGNSQSFTVTSADDIYATSQIAHISDTLTLTISMPKSTTQSSYLQDLTIILHNCDAGCELCSGSGNLCSDCQAVLATDYFLQPSGIGCLTTCPVGYIQDSTNLICLKCDQNCKECSGTVDNCIQCGLMNGGQTFLHNNDCLNSCPTGYFQDTTNYDCDQCTTGCAQCYGSGLTKCTKCVTDTVPATDVPYFKVKNVDECATSCAGRFFGNTTTNICEECHQSCGSCTDDALDCQSCRNVSGIVYFHHTDDVCYQVCPDGYFGDTTDNQCDQCTPGCKTCFGTGLTNCLSCQTDASSNKLYKHIGASTCGQTCPEGQFIDANIDYECQPCAIQCAECVDNAHKCTKTGSNTDECNEHFYFLSSNNSCISDCPIGKFQDTSTNQCTACTAGCAQCYGSGLTKCTKCVTDTVPATDVPYFKVKNVDECATSCAGRFFGNTTTNMCEECHQSCSSCTDDALDCQSCRNVSGIVYFHHTDDVCYQVCPDGYFGDTAYNQCKVCHNHCQTCFGSTVTQCFKCKTYLSVDYYLIFESSQCSLNCPVGQFKDSNNQCSKCDSVCQQCVDSSNKCTKCQSHNGFQVFLENNQCVYRCEDGFYPQSSNNSCQACADGCQTCVGSTVYDCLTCGTDISSNKFYKYIGQTTCGTSCPRGQFIDSNIDFYCQPCAQQCAECIDSAHNCTVTGGGIDQCNIGYFYHSVNNSCINNCPDKYYEDSGTAQCKSCSTGCALCYGGGSQCTKCEIDVDTSTPYYKKINQDQCTSSCPAGQYEQNIGLLCKSCHQSCLTCDTSAEDCSACKNVTGIVYYKLNKQCLALCPDTYYGDKGSNQCATCHLSCQTCYGPAINQCTSCRVNTVNYYLQYNTNTCVDQCPDGQYDNATSLKCLICDSNCETCTGNAQTCTSCFMDGGAYVFLQGTICVQYCQDGFYGNDVSYQCQACAQGCATCFGPDLTDCDTCTYSAAETANFYKIYDKTECMKAACPNGQFISSRYSYQCQFCAPQCKTCEGAADNCTTTQGCADNYYFFNDTYDCLSQCPEGYYNGIDYCESCTVGCSICYDSGLTSCKKCQTDLDNNVDYFKVLNIDQCTIDCPSGYYQQQIGLICVSCHFSCLTCQSSAQDCTACKNVTGIMYYKHNNQCLVFCPDGYYGDKSSNQCNSCNSACQTCFSDQIDECYSCKTDGSTPYYLQFSTTTCVSTCPVGQYQNITSHKCLLCDSNCRTCEQEPKNCTSCFLVNGQYVYLDNNICIQQCPDGFYQDTGTRECEPCADGCLTCDGPALTNCYTCGNHSVSATQYYKVINHTICDPSCPLGQFIDANIEHYCQPCAPQCQACQDQADKCILNEGCAQGYYFYNSTSACVAQCIDGLYQDIMTGFCQSCAGGCLTCSGSSLQECQSCGEDIDNPSNIYYKRIGIQQCTLDCPPGEYQLDLGGYFCAKCHESCATCEDNQTHCQSCTDVVGISYYHHNDKCLAICPDGYYGRKSDNLCVVCHVGCATCFGPSQFECYSCRTDTDTNTPYYLSYSTTQCLEQCLDGQYQNITNNRCYVCDSNCKTCDIQSRNCTSCFLNNGQYVFLQNQICVQVCADGFYQDFTTFQCESCADGCATCFGPLITQCDSCQDFNGQSFYKDRNSKTCGEQFCPTGQYINAASPNICQFCSPQCIYCQTLPDNCIGSYGCAQDYFFYAPTNDCLLICPNGYYPDNVNTFDCLQCQDGCETCYGPGLDKCSKCQINPIDSVPYFKRVYYDQCVQDCPPGYYQVTATLECQKCHESCILCETSPYDCRSCKNSSGITYFYYDNQCLVSCPDSFWGYTIDNTCQPCQPQCPLCFGNTTEQCYSCTEANGTDYFLQFGTTYCVQQCPYGQYENYTTHSCGVCNINCATCDINSTNCLTCTYVNTINIVYLLGSKCVTYCPQGYWENSTVQLDHQCSLCHQYCIQCVGPTNLDCSLCSNITDQHGVKTIYYKDLYSTTCNPDCPDGQFIASVKPNLCVPCNASCQLCEITSTNCSKCTFSYFLFEPQYLCTASCPIGYFNDYTLTANNYYCTICHEGCFSCTGTGLNNCQQCQNTTSSGSTTIYYKHHTSQSCVKQCDTGYFGNDKSNQCQQCQGGCVTCDVTASKCFKCEPYNGQDYFKVMNADRCLRKCPNGTYGNVSDYKCIQCPYFSYEGQCILECPDGTNVQQINGKATCVECSTTQRTCDDRNIFQLKTQIADDGQSLVHQVKLPQGLHQSVTQDELKGVQILLIRRSRRRLLDTAQVLKVKEIRIQRPDNIFITTQNGQDIDLSNSEIQVNFPGGSLISQDGTPYSSTTDYYYLDDPQFVSQYEQIIINDFTPQIPGITITSLAILLLIIVLAISEKRTHHEIMSFIMFIQCIGLLRMRGYPIDYYIYTFLEGFSHTQFNFLPNLFYMLFPEGYYEQTTDTIAYTYTDHNLIRGLGSCMFVFLILQIILFIYYIIKSHQAHHVTRFKYLQQSLVSFFMVKTIFSIVCSLMSLTLNQILSSIQYMISQLTAMLIILVIFAYFVISVRKYIPYELYKVNNAIRAICIAVMPVNTYGGMIPLLILELLFVIADAKLYRELKINKKTFYLDRAIMLIGLILASLLEDYTAIMAIEIVLFAGLYGIKLYYLIICVKNWVADRRKRQLSDIAESQQVNKNSAKLDGFSQSQSINIQKANMSIYKLNDNHDQHSDNLNNQTLITDKSPQKKLAPLMTKKQTHSKNKLIYDSESQEEQQQKKDISNQSQGELVIYLDPKDYQKQFERPPQKMDQKIGMRTTGNFYRRKNAPYKDDKIQIIKIEPNQSEIDPQSDIISELSDGDGWLKEKDKRNEERRRKNQPIWKIVDIQDNKNQSDEEGNSKRKIAEEDD